VIIPALVGSNEPYCNPDEQQTTNEHQSRDLEQPDHPHCHGRPNHDRTDRPPDNCPGLLLLGKVACRKGNDNCVVSRKNEINDDDGQKRREKLWRKQLHGTASQLRFVMFVIHKVLFQLEGCGRPSRKAVLTI